MEHSLSMTNLDATQNNYESNSNSFDSYVAYHAHHHSHYSARPSSLHLGLHEEVEDNGEMGVVSDGYGDPMRTVVMRKGNPQAMDGLFLRDGETHNVWKPGSEQAAEFLRERTTSPPESAPPGAGGLAGGWFFQRANLWERQKEVEDRIEATQQALKHEMRELATSSLSLNIPPEPSPVQMPSGGKGAGPTHRSFRAVSMQMLDRLRKDKVRESVHFHDVVRMCLEEKKMHRLSSGPLNGSVIQLQQASSSTSLHFFPPGSPLQVSWQDPPAPPLSSSSSSVAAVPTPAPVSTSVRTPLPPITPKSLPPGGAPATPRIPVTPRTPRPRAVPISIHKWREILQKEQGLDAISENTETEVSSNAEHSPPAPSLKPCKRKNSISTVV